LNVLTCLSLYHAQPELCLTARVAGQFVQQVRNVEMWPEAAKNLVSQGWETPRLEYKHVLPGFRGKGELQARIYVELIENTWPV